MSDRRNQRDEPEGPVSAFSDKKGVIIGMLLGLVILGAIAAVVGHRDVAPVSNVLGIFGLK